MGLSEQSQAMTPFELAALREDDTPIEDALLKKKKNVRASGYKKKSSGENYESKINLKEEEWNFPTTHDQNNYFYEQKMPFSELS